MWAVIVGGLIGMIVVFEFFFFVYQRTKKILLFISISFSLILEEIEEEFFQENNVEQQ